MERILRKNKIDFFGSFVKKKTKLPTKKYSC